MGFADVFAFGETIFCQTWDARPKPYILIRSPGFHIRVAPYTNFHNACCGLDLSQNLKRERLTNPGHRQGVADFSPASCRVSP